jgi:arsenite methyltransferase
VNVTNAPCVCSFENASTDASACVQGRVPPEIKKNMDLWVGCVAGALSDYEYIAKLAKAGFDSIDIEPTGIYDFNDARSFVSERGANVDQLAKDLHGRFISAFIRATKPSKM